MDHRQLNPAIDAFRDIPATVFTISSGCTASQDNPEVLGYISHGSWVIYDRVDFGQGASHFQARVSTPMTGGIIEIQLIDDGTAHAIILGSCLVPSTGGWNNWVKVNSPILPTQGIHRLKLLFHKPAKADPLTIFDLSSFSFAASLAGLDREPATRILAAEADSMSANIRIDASGDIDGGLATSAFRDGDGMAFARVNFKPDTCWFEARVWIEGSGASLEVHITDMAAGEGRLVGSLKIDSQLDIPDWQTLGCEIKAISGRKILELVYRNPSGASGFRLNWVRLSSLTKGRQADTPRRIDATPIPTSAWSYAHNIQLEPCNEGGQNIGYLRDGSFVGYGLVDFGSESWCWTSARVAAVSDGGSIDILIDQELCACIEVPRTGDWQEWVTAGSRLSKPLNGVHRLDFRFRGGESFLFNVQWFGFAQLPLPNQAPRVTLNGKPIILKDNPVNPMPQSGSSEEANFLLSMADLAAISKQGKLDLHMRLEDSLQCRITGPRGELFLQADSLEAQFRPHGQAEVLRSILPFAPQHLSGKFLVPLVALSLNTGLSGRWSSTEHTLELRCHKVFRKQRKRLNLANGQLFSDQNSLIRGPSIIFDRENSLPSYSLLDMVRSQGFNALHIYAENPDIHSAPHQLTHYIDDLVEYTANEGLYLILGASCGILPGSFKLDWLERFWEHYAPRYAKQSHVSYEIARQPFAWSAPYPPDVIAMERQLLTQIRQHAPQTHVMLFSYSNLAGPEAVLRDIQAMHLDEEERELVVIAWQGFDRNTELIQSCLKVLQQHQWASLNIEVPLGHRLAIQPINPVTPDFDLIRLCENHKTGWLSSLKVKFLGSPELWAKPAADAGIIWKVDQ